MKRSLVFLAVFSIALAASATNRTVRLSVSGWTCGSCAAASRIALKKLDGVEEVTTNAPKKEAVVRYDDTQVSPEKMVATLARLGYRAVLAPDRPATSAASAESGAVSFFEVPLGCPAVEKLGCGSLATPILDELEDDAQVAQAWLNHEGTVLAVVWKGSGPAAAAGRRVRVANAFQKSGLGVQPLAGSELESTTRSFSTRKGWYRGEDVANLSREEARVLAARLIQPVEQELGPSKAAALKKEFQGAFERCFIGGEPLDRADFAKIALKYVNQAGVDKMERSFDDCFDGNEPEK